MLVLIFTEQLTRSLVRYLTEALSYVQYSKYLHLIAEQCTHMRLGLMH